MNINEVLLKMMGNEEFSPKDLSNCIGAFNCLHNEFGLTDEEEKTLDKLIAIEKFVETVSEFRSLASDLQGK